MESLIVGETQRQAAEQISMANTFGSLQLCATLDWGIVFEEVSLVEEALQRDPAGVYGRMDFLSRDRYRQAVEELAEPSGEAQVQVALRSIERARRAVDDAGPDERRHHVGHYLIGDGRREFERELEFVCCQHQELLLFDSKTGQMDSLPEDRSDVSSTELKPNSTVRARFYRKKPLWLVGP